MNYMLVVHYKFVDVIRNEYFKTLDEMNNRIKELKNSKNEIIHKFEIKECK